MYRIPTDELRILAENAQGAELRRLQVELDRRETTIALTSAQTAEKWGISRTALRKHIKKGHLPLAWRDSAKKGTAWLLPADAPMYARPKPPPPSPKQPPAKTIGEQIWQLGDRASIGALARKFGISNAKVVEIYDKEFERRLG